MVGEKVVLLFLFIVLVITVYIVAASVLQNHRLLTKSAQQRLTGMFRVRVRCCKTAFCDLLARVKDIIKIEDT